MMCVCVCMRACVRACVCVCVYYTCTHHSPDSLLLSLQMPTSVPADTVSMQNLLGNQESPPTHTEEEKVEEVLPKKGGQTSKGDVTKSATNVATKK